MPKYKTYGEQIKTQLPLNKPTPGAGSVNIDEQLRIDAQRRGVPPGQQLRDIVTNHYITHPSNMSGF